MAFTPAIKAGIAHRRPPRSIRTPPVPLHPTSFARVSRRPLESARYRSIDYRAELRKHRILISMSGKGNRYDDSMVETFFRSLKSELVWCTVFDKLLGAAA